MVFCAGESPLACRRLKMLDLKWADTCWPYSNLLQLWFGAKHEAIEARYDARAAFSKEAQPSRVNGGESKRVPT